jgi:tetratricopeptide (TPR) repeat protein
MDSEDKFPSEDELWEKTRSTDPREKAEALHDLAHHAMHRNDWTAVAAFHATEAEILLDLHDSEYPRALVMQGLALDAAGRSEEALKIIDQALDFGRSYLDENLLAEMTFTKATLVDSMGRTEESLKLHDSAIALFTAVEKPERVAYVQIDKGDICYKKSRFAEASVAFEEAMKFFRFSGDSSMFGRARDRFCSCLVEQGKHGEALQHLKDNIDLYEFLGESERHMFAKYRVGWNLLVLQRPEEALPLLREARAFYTETQDFRTAADIDAHIVDALRALHQFAEADDTARRMRAFLESTGNIPRLMVTDINLAKGAFARGDDETAESLLWSVVERADSFGYARQGRIARLMLAQYFVENDAFEQAKNSLGNVTPEDWAENYAKRAAHLNVLAMVALGKKDRLHARTLCRKVVDMAYLHDLHEENARAHLTLSNLAEYEKDVLEMKSLRAQAVALYLAGGFDEKARRVSKLLLPGQGVSGSGYEEHLDEQPVRDDTGPIDTITEGSHPEWMERAGWVEKKDNPPGS